MVANSANDRDCGLWNFGNIHHGISSELVYLYAIVKFRHAAQGSSFFSTLR